MGLTFRSEEKEREKDWNPGTHGFGSIPLPGEEFNLNLVLLLSPHRGERQAIESLVLPRLDPVQGSPGSNGCYLLRSAG